MPWTKLDDGFYDNPKIEQAGNEGAGLYCRCLAYASRHLTNGFIPKPTMDKLAEKPRVIQKVIEAGLVEELDNGFWIPDYLEYNMEDEKVREERAKAKERMAQLRAQRRDAVRGKNA